MREEVARIIATRGKMHNPVTGSGGMLVGTVEEVGPASRLGLAVGDRIATLVSLTLTPLSISDGLTRWDGLGEQVPCTGHAILFGRSIAAHLPQDLPADLALAVMDVCGARRADPPGGGPLRRSGPAAGGRRDRRGGQERVAGPGRGPPGRRRPCDRRRPGRAERQAAARRRTRRRGRPRRRP